MAQEVDAVIVEPEAVSIECTTGSIAANFDAMEARVDAILADYKDWKPSADSTEDVKQCKSQKKYLNALAKDIDERRKAVKREYLRPLDAFEERANGIRDKIRAVSARLDAVAKEAEQAEKDAKEAELREHYEAYAGLLVPVVPYERIADPKWLNKTTGIKKAMEELEAKVGKIAADWEALKNTPMEFYAEAEACFFNTLDLGAAISHNSKLIADRERIEAMKAAMAPEPEPTPEPEAVRYKARPIVCDSDEHEPPIPICEPEPIPAPMPAPEPSLPMVMVISSCTVSQAKEIGRFCGSIGVTGTFKRGTLAEVFRREAASGRR